MQQIRLSDIKVLGVISEGGGGGRTVEILKIIIT